MAEDQVKAVVKSILPQLDQTIKNLLSGNIELLKTQLKEEITSTVWDKAIAEIGKITNLPPEIVSTLQKVDDLVKNSKGEMTELYSDLTEKYIKFLDKIKDTDLDKTVTMSYSVLQKVKIKASLAWGSICAIAGWLCGYLFGLLSV